RKGLLRAIQHNALDVAAAIQALDGLRHLHHQRHSQHVVWRIVKGDARHVAGSVKNNVLVLFGCSGGGGSGYTDRGHGFIPREYRWADYVAKPANLQEERTFLMDSN